MIKFTEFIDKKEREAKRQLKIIEKILLAHGLHVKDHLDDDDPYIYVSNPKKNTIFEGIRIYKVCSHIAFRVQKEEKTEPFGTAYPIDIEEMFTDLITDYKPEEAGKKIIAALNTEVIKFFEKSALAEKELRDNEFERGGSPWGKVTVSPNAYNVDYANLTYMNS